MFNSSWRRRPRLLWLIVVCVLIGLDQVSKAYFASTIILNSAVQVTSWLNLVHVLNEGAAFSLFADAQGWQRPVLVAIGLLVVIPVAIVSLTVQGDPALRWLGGMVVAGGTGNLIDRMQTGAVVDFLDFHWRSWHWPAFNLADVYIVCAVIVWILLSFRSTLHFSAGTAPSKAEP